MKRNILTFLASLIVHIVLISAVLFYFTPQEKPSVQQKPISIANIKLIQEPKQSIEQKPIHAIAPIHIPQPLKPTPVEKPPVKKSAAKKIVRQTAQKKEAPVKKTATAIAVPAAAAKKENTAPIMQKTMPIKPAPINTAQKPMIDRSKIYAAVNRVKTYPRIAKKMRIEGTVYVKFTLMPNGTVQNIQAQGGKTILQKAAIKAIYDALPYFPKVPEKTIIHIPIEYKLQQ